MIRFASVCIVVVSIIFMVYGAEVSMQQKPGAQITTGLEVQWSAGQVISSSHIRLEDEATLDDDWLDRKFFGYIGTKFLADARVGERVQVLISYLASVQYQPNATIALSNIGLSRTIISGLSYAYGKVSLGGTLKDSRTSLAVGNFPYIYAPETKSLGSYLLSSGVYPGFVSSGEGVTYVSGIWLNTRLPASIAHDVMLIADINTSDMSVAYILTHAQEAFRINAGVVLHRLIWARSRRTSPVSADKPLDAYKNYYSDSLGTAILDDNGDTTFYSKSGVKLMLRGGVDFKKILGLSSKLGPDDLKLYAEAAVLGVKNYPGYYDNIAERIPVMVGLNLPMFNIVDVLAVEAEYYGSPWKNVPTTDDAPVPYYGYDYDPIIGWRLKSPDIGAGEQGEKDNIKWAIVTEKSIKRFTIRAKVASDHFGYPDPNGLLGPDEFLQAPSEWYWQLVIKAGL